MIAKWGALPTAAVGNATKTAILPHRITQSRTTRRGEASLDLGQVEPHAEAVVAESAGAGPLAVAGKDVGRLLGDPDREHRLGQLPLVLPDRLGHLAVTRPGQPEPVGDREPRLLAGVLHHPDQLADQPGPAQLRRD